MESDRSGADDQTTPAPSTAELVKEIFADACDLTPDLREGLLQKRCGADGELRKAVDTLLRAHDEAGDFFANPTSTAPPDDSAAGQHVGRYKLLQKIGEGGFGTVYMAEQEEPVRRRVALKIIKLGMDTKAVIARFEAERQALAMMDHPNIARVFDAGATDAGRPYFVMELVHGIPITHYCDSNKLTTRQRLELFMPVCRAVQHAHQKGIIHRDIKPSNVLVTLHDGVPVPKVIDFGIAKATSQRLTEKTLFTEFRQFIGTPEYMSPEQAEMSGLDIDTRSDIYALGVLLYELLTGTTPFDARSLRAAAYAEIQRIIREVEPPRPSTRISTLGETLATTAEHRGIESRKLSQLLRGELDWIVMKCMEKDRTRRYETATSVAADILRYLNDEAVEASPPSATYKLRKFARKYRRPLRAAILVALLLLVATIFSSWQAVRAIRARAAELTQRQRADEQAAVAEGINQFFLEEVFGLADPTRNDRAGIKLVEALHIAAGKVDARFPNEPRLQGEIHSRLGEIFLGIDQPQQAVEELQKAVALWTTVVGAKAPITLRSRSNLGMALYKITRWSEARDTFEATLIDQTQVLGPAHPDTLQTESHLAVVLMEIHGGWWNSFGDLPDDGRDLEVSRNAYHQALAALGPRHQATLNAESAMSWALRWRQKSAEALGYAKDASIGLRETRGPDDADAMWATYNYAVCLVETGRTQEAVAELRPLLVARNRILGPSHVDTVITAWRLALSLRSIGKEQESFAVLEGVRAHLEEIQAISTWQRGRYLLDVADCYQQLKRYDRAAEFIAVGCKMADVPPQQETEWHGYAGWLNRLAGVLLTFPAPELRNPEKALEYATRACELTNYTKAPFLNTLRDALTAEGKIGEAKAVFVNAETRCREAIESYPNSSELLIDFGLLLESQGKFAEAKDAFAKATHLKPDMAGAWAFLGECDRVNGQLDRMAEDYSQAILLKPDEQWYWHERGYAYMELGKDKQAIPDHTKTIELDDTDAEERLSARSYRILGQYQLAKADCSRAIELDSNNKVSWYRRSQSEIKLGETREAASDLAQAIKLCASASADDQYFIISDLTANPDQQWQNIKAAVELAEKACQSTGYRNTQLVNALRTAFRADGRPGEADATFAKAEAAWREAIRLQPNSADLYAELGSLLQLEGKFPEAQAMYGEEIRLQPKMAEGWVARGSCELATDQFAKMAEDYGQAIKLKPYEQRYWHERAYAYMRLGEHEKAIADASKTIELGDSDSDERLRRASSYEALGNLTKAEEDYSRALELNPGDFGAWWKSARLNSRLGRAEKARADLANAIAHCSNNPDDQNALAWDLVTNPDPNLHEPKAAVDLAGKAVAAHPERGDIWNTLGVAQYRAGNWQAAVTALDKSTELRHGGDAIDWFFLAMACQKLGQTDAALKWRDRAIDWMYRNRAALKRNSVDSDQLIAFRTEAEALLAVPGTSQPASPLPPSTSPTKGVAP